MRHYGPEPPWRGEGEFGRWVWRNADPDDWFATGGHWEWLPPGRFRGPLLAHVSRILRDTYLPGIHELLDGDTVAMQLLTAEPS